MRYTIHPFIFTWKRHFERACKLEDQLREIFPSVTVINSDDTVTRDGWVNVGDSSYFGAQFQKALELFNGDILFHVQADASYGDFRKLVEDAKFYMRFYDAGIYAPNVDYTWWSSEKTDIVTPPPAHSNIRFVANTDETAWFIRKEVLEGIHERKIDLSLNPLGWAIDCVLSCVSYAKGMPVLRDYRHTVKHPQGTGYDYPTAEAQMERMVASLDSDLQLLYSHIRGDRQALLRYLSRDPDLPRVLGTRRDYEIGSLRHKRLANFYQLSNYPTFVETGTFKGDGAQWALDTGFESVYSIELSEELHQRAVERFTGNPKVHLLHGDSKTLLPSLVERLSGPTVFYLDAHWSGRFQGIDTGCAADGAVPLKAECEALMKYRDIERSLIIVDDVRLMVDPASPPGNFGSEIKTWLLDQWCSRRRFYATYLDDSVIFQRHAP